MERLNSYERFKTSLEHKEPDRVPFHLGSTAVTGINIHALKEFTVDPVFNLSFFSYSQSIFQRYLKINYAEIEGGIICFHLVKFLII